MTTDKTPTTAQIIMEDTIIRCMDCDVPEGETDMTLSKEQWLMIHPDDGGILCPSCIVKRASKLKNVINVQAVITFIHDYYGDRKSSPTAARRALEMVRETILELEETATITIFGLPFIHDKITNYKIIEAALTAAPGFVMVPREPTDELLRTICKKIQQIQDMRIGAVFGWQEARHLWSDITAAATKGTDNG